MWKQCTCFAFLIVLLALIQAGTVFGAFDPLDDPDLIGWWKCDEGEGSVVADASPNGNDGTFVNGDPAWTGGVNGNAVELVGPTLVEIPAMGLTLTEATMAGWFLPNTSQADWASMIMHRGTGTAHGFNFLADGRLAYHWNDDSASWGYRGDAYYAADEWTHCAVTIEPDKATFYVNGEAASVNSIAHAASTWDNPIWLGGDDPGAWSGRQMNGALDDVMFFSRALTAAEIKSLVPPKYKAMRPTPADKTVGVTTPLLQWKEGDTALFHNVYLGTSPELTEADKVASNQPFSMYFHIPGWEPGTTYYWRIDEVEADMTTVHEGVVWSFTAQALIAYNPTPADGSGSISPKTTLSWLPGQGAVKYQLYLGDDADAVSAGAAETDQGELEDETFTPADLAGATTYYWRVDDITVDGSVQTGDVWSFTTFMLVDDFEGYTDDEGSRIYESWIDGWTNNTGSTVGYLDPPFAEQSITHGPGQSMPLAYDNSQSPFYSEAEYTFDGPQDWTIGGVDTLSLWVQGYGAMETVEVTESGGAMDVTGAGADIWGNSDQFTYAHKTLNGNGTMVARVVSNGTGSNTWAKGGVMIRQSLNGGSTHAMMIITDGGGNGASFQYRPVADAGSSNNDTVAVIEPPYWVKIERLGDTLSGYVSADGNFWNTLGSAIIAMEDPIHIGICVTSHASGEERTFQFDNISSTGGVSGQWQGAIISAPLHNDAQNFYVAVEDSAGNVAVASNATVVNADAWTPVEIPLADLAGVNLARVQKVYVGVGDRDNPTADGSGRIYIDDIRVTMP